MSSNMKSSLKFFELFAAFLEHQKDSLERHSSPFEKLCFLRFLIKYITLFVYTPEYIIVAIHDLFRNFFLKSLTSGSNFMTDTVNT